MSEKRQGPKRFRTVSAHERSFERAPRVRAGDVVRHDRDDGKNPGWFVGTDPGGVEGYFPCRWFEVDLGASTARALRDYDAAELTIEAQAEVECLAEESGWLLVRTNDDREGWIPAACLP